MFPEVLLLDVQLLDGYHHPGTVAGKLARKQTGMSDGTTGKLGGNEARDDQDPAAHFGAELGTRVAPAEEILGH